MSDSELNAVKPKRRKPRQNSDSTSKKSNSTRLAIAIIGIAGSIGVAFVKGYFDRIHIDSRLDNLKGVAVDVGNWSAGNSNAGWLLDKPLGTPDAPPRKFLIPIHFSKSFTYPPKVFVSVKLIDASNSANIRWSTNVDDVTREGFSLTLETHSDSIVYWLTGDYVAFQQ